MELQSSKIFANLTQIVDRFVDDLESPFGSHVSKQHFFDLQREKTDTICPDLPKSAKIKQYQTKDRQACPFKHRLPKQTTKTPSPKIRGRRCHAAWRLQSGPGPKAPEACLGD